MIRVVNDKDVDSIVKIYNYYVSETAVTFEVDTISTQTMLERIDKIRSENLPWLVAEDNSGKVIGYTYATKWKERSAYRFSVEITVYLSPEQLNKGVGTKLYQSLISELKLLPVNAIIGGITLPNPSSVALHEKFGMRQVAHFKKVGFKFEQWQDTGYWQALLKDSG